MKNRLADLAYRRSELLNRIEAQRADVAEISRHWQKPLAVVDAGISAVRFLQRHPAWVIGAVSALLAWRRKGIVGLAQKGWRLLFLYPSTLALGLKFFSFATRSSGEESPGEISVAAAKPGNIGHSLPENKQLKGE